MIDFMAETMGERLRRLRGKRSLGQVAKATGVSRGFISQVEKGLSGLGRENLKKFADYYKVSIDELVTGEKADEVEARQLREVRAEYDAIPSELRTIADRFAVLPDDGRAAIAAMMEIMTAREETHLEQSLEDETEEWTELGATFAERLGEENADELMLIVASAPDDELFARLAAFFGRLAGE